jgi:hypothetical protein
MTKTTATSTTGRRRHREPITVRLTEDDFEFAIQGDPCHCPVANALHRITKKGVHVSILYAAIAGDNYYALPLKAVRFISAYDQRGTKSLLSFTVKPITIREARNIFKKLTDETVGKP